MSSLLGHWPIDRIAQVTISNLTPDISVCNNFFRITDLDVYRSLFKKCNYSVGQHINSEKISSICSYNSGKPQSTIKDMIQNVMRNRLPIAITARNFVWSIGKWKSRSFIKWLEDFSPDVVFFQSGHISLTFRIVEFICDHYKVPLLMQTTDDYLSSKFTIDPFFWYNLISLRKWYNRFAKRSKAIFPIGDRMAEVYSSKFGGIYYPVMNSVTITDRVFERTNDIDELRFVYTGSLHSGRFNMLCHLAEKLHNMGGKYQKAHINVYSQVPPTPKEMKSISNLTNISYEGGLYNQHDVSEVQQGGDVLIHVESFRPRDKYITRLSISTKIPEYMVSGTCILAIGPKDVASIKYITDQGFGFVISDFSDADLIIDDLWCRNNRVRMRDRAFSIVKARHNMTCARELITGIVMNQE